MLRLACLPVLFLLLAAPVAAQPFTFDDALRGGGPSSDTGEGIALAADGSRTVAGTFEGTATFGDVTITSAGDSDFFLVKYAPDGEAVWGRRGGTSVFNDFGTATAIAGDGSVYATGFFTGIATFDGGGNPDASLTTFSDFDVFLVKYDAAGDLQWVRQAGGTGQDTGRDLAIDASGNVYLAGGFEGTGTFGAVTLTSAGSTDAFLAKYDPSGTVVWARRGGSVEGDLAYGVAVTADGRAHLSGSFRGVAIFGSLPIQSAGSSDVFVVQYDAAGTPVWLQGIGANGSEYTRGGGIGLGPDGEVYVHGSFSNTILVGGDVLVSQGFTDIFVAKLDADGDEVWGRRGGGSGTNFSAALAVDASGNALAVGYADGTGTFADTPISTQGRDGYFAVFDREGDLLTVELLGGSSQDAATGVALSDALGRFAVAGLFRGTASFGGTTLTSAGSNDVFVLGGEGADTGGPAFDLTAAATSPLTVPPGGAVSFVYAVANNTPSAAPGQLFFTAERGGATVAQGVIRSGTLPAGATVSGSYTQNVPATVPPGTYTYRLRIGRFPSLVVDEEVFVVTVTGEARASGVEAWSLSGVTPWEVAPAATGVPLEAALLAVYPNPFARQTTLALDLAEAQTLRVEVLDVLGRRVALAHDGPLAAGAHRVVIEAAGLPAGVYLVRASGETLHFAQRVTLAQ